jgi:hypothetical protein
MDGSMEKFTSVNHLATLLADRTIKSIHHIEPFAIFHKKTLFSNSYGRKILASGQGRSFSLKLWWQVLKF